MNAMIEKVWGLKNVVGIRDFKAKGNRIVRLIHSEEGQFVLLDQQKGVIPIRARTATGLVNLN
ncbi:hypothetical protein J14TS2_32670 [Bacillus sp. J14TS2]|uniref:hypothetical protein n=1 Tax=Bacillus sp. J14TS2 TaxID=2807188 RepID=UPI001B0E38B0|nr:hypothetical protein [Bacillus sp. J14TS2]GIN72792.1 hypothetical protein J14TS2_32670 [Bacillus sp. J14TS2]